MKRKHWFSSVACAALCASVAAWAAIDTVTPDTATIGTTLSIHGSGFGAKKPKVALVPTAGSKSITLKVLTNSDTDITAQLAKAFFGAEGTYNVVVTPPGGEAQTSAAVVGVSVGQIGTVTPAAPAAAGTITIAGTQFGAKKGKVLVGGKKAKVTTWTDTQIVATLHKKTPTGSQSLEVTNKIGNAVKVGAVDVGGDGGGEPEPGTLPRMTARLYRFNGNADKTETQVNQVGPGTVVSATVSGTGGQTFVVQVTFATKNLLTIPNGSSSDDPDVVTVTDSGEPPTAWSGTSGFLTKIIARDGSVSVDVRGDLPRLGGSADPETQENIIISFDIPR